MIKGLPIAVAACLVAGCLKSIPFQPPPTEYEMWVKEGASMIEVQKATLECGYPDPFNSGRYRRSMNEIVLSDLCMQASGFHYSSDRNWRTYMCPEAAWDRIPACRPGVPRPKRDPKRRLGSPFCQANSTSRICEP